MHFQANSGLILLTDELINDWSFVDTGATLSIVPCTSNASLLAPFLREQMANQSPLGFCFKNRPISEEAVHSQIFAIHSGRSHSGH
jgi:hypothetical protein